MALSAIFGQVLAGMQGPVFTTLWSPFQAFPRVFLWFSRKFANCDGTGCFLQRFFASFCDHLLAFPRFRSCSGGPVLRKCNRFSSLFLFPIFLGIFLEVLRSIPRVYSQKAGRWSRFSQSWDSFSRPFLVSFEPENPQKSTAFSQVAARVFCSLGGSVCGFLKLSPKIPWKKKM